MLVVDDEARLGQALRMVLSDEFDVVVTTDPLEALARLTRGESYDVILCDVMMPAMNGMQLRERVHAHSPEVADRFVFVTGGSLPSLPPGVSNPVLSKPFDLAELRALVRRSCTARAAAQG
jgi:CheY-like chemotaxis protein